MEMERKGGELVKNVRDLTHHNSYLNKENNNLEEMVKVLDKNLEQIIFQGLEEKKRLEDVLGEREKEIKALKEKSPYSATVVNQSLLIFLRKRSKSQKDGEGRKQENQKIPKKR